MSDGYKRKHESGYIKRQKKQEKEDALNKMKGSLLKFVTKGDTTSTSGNDSSINSFVSSTSPPAPSMAIPEPMVSDSDNSDTDTVKQCDHATSFTSEPVNEFEPHLEPTVADLASGIKKTKESISNDPAEWEINADLIAYYAENIPSQNLKSDLSLKGRQFGEKIRYVRKEYFIRKLANGEIVSRDWLIYSPSTGKVFCYICKVFVGCNTGCASSYSAPPPRNQFITGFDDWKNVIARITSHEKSKDHFVALSTMIQYKKSTRIDAELQKENEKSCKYWTEVLKRVVEVIKFLAERGLAFRGDNQLHNSPNNGNYLGCIDLLAEFDPFLREHIKRYGNPGKGNVSYLSANICDEFINILGNKVLKQIIAEIKDAKYYGISIDSTPDISHVDQLTLIIRYILKNGNIVERFLQFIPIEQHDGQYIFDVVLGIFQLHGIDIKNCRSQSYDNASNMSGIYSGVQARFREINHLAEWVPCAAHSLNLVGSATVECCSAAVDYFGVVQSVYVFFSASPKRWSTLKERLKEKENLFVLQSLSETRWSSRSDATRAFYANYSQIRQALCDVADSQHQPPAAVHEAKSLVKHLDNFETALMCVIWKDLLQKIDIVNKALQEPGIELCIIIQLYDSLIKYFCDTRSKFEAFESLAKGLTESDYKEATQRNRIRKRFHDEVMDTSNPSSNLSASDKFCIQQFYVIIDRLNNEMEKRRAAYKVLYERFNFLHDNTSLSIEEVVAKTKALIELYPSDLEDEFTDEFLLFSQMFGDSKSVSDKIKLQIDNKLVASFPNVNIAFRIYLSIIGTNSEGERSFSKLKLIKNYLRSTMGQVRLSSLALLSIENEVMREMTFEDVILDFANNKSRKVNVI